MLRSENPDPKIGSDAEENYSAMHGGEPEAVWEYGHWWIVDRATGAQYDAVDASGPGSCGGWGFERVSEGDVD